MIVRYSFGEKLYDALGELDYLSWIEIRVSAVSVRDSKASRLFTWSKQIEGMTR